MMTPHRPLAAVPGESVGTLCAGSVDVAGIFATTRRRGAGPCGREKVGAR
jgi:hypothetical protein